MTTSVLASATYWRDILERAGRQAAQTALPIVAALTASGHGLNYKAAGLAVAVAVGVTVLKALLSVTASTDEPLLWQLLDRAAPAAAGTALGFVPVDAANIVSVNWTNVGYATVAAAVVAILAVYVTPPSGPTTSQPAAEPEPEPEPDADPDA